MENRKFTNLEKRLNRIKKSRRYHPSNNRRLKKIALEKTIVKQSSRCELYDATAFLYPQTKHFLIPQIKSAEDNLALAKEIKSFRQGLFILFCEKIKMLKYGESI